MKQDDLLKDFEVKAKELIDNGSVSNLIFSGPTYQFEIVSPSQTIWPFIQLDDKLEIKDAFCSCETAEKKGSCEHLAASLLIIYQTSKPLHIRFQNSLWNLLCRSFAEEYGYDTHIITKNGKKYLLISEDQAKFSLEVKESSLMNFFMTLFEKRPKETEETSLKFTNLNQEEITHWKEGRPSIGLKYELSFWADLAKEMMWRQVKGEQYVISFEYDEESMPTHIHIEWVEFKVSFAFTQEILRTVIPGFATVDAPLKVFASPRSPYKISYDKIKRGFLVQETIPSLPIPDTANRIILNEWLYLPKQGFTFLKEERLKNRSLISSQEIPKFLDEEGKSLQREIEELIHFEPLKASYHIYFDAEWNLHIEGYLFEKGDLKKSNAALFKHWAYLDNRGFFKLEGVRFPTIETVISPHKLSDFINFHRNWLNNFSGFQIHLTSVEAQLNYLVTPEKTLRFLTKNLGDENKESKDFGEWIYFEGNGFFAKSRGKIGFHLYPGLEIQAHEVQDFIKLHHDELEWIPYFFTQESPLQTYGLKLELKPINVLHVVPFWEVIKNIHPESLHFFGDVIYIDQKGFYEIPYEKRLPDRFKNELMIEEELLPFFVKYELPLLKRFISSLDPRLVIPQTYTLQLEHLERDSSGILKSLLYYQTEIGKIACHEIIEAMKAKKRFLFSPAGLLDLHDEHFEWLKSLSTPQLSSYLKQGSIPLTMLEIIRLEAFQKIQEPLGNSEDQLKTKLLYEQLKSFVPPFDPNLTGLKSELRLYQKTGLNWLWFLYLNQLSGLLCDDMGLGKTHQAMALLTAIYNYNGDSKKRYIVVCPTSVIYHWQDKLSQFLPHLKTYIFHGIKRNREEFENCDVLLTSYGIVRTERELLKEFSFELAIFDEIQIAKNQHSRIHSALLSIKSKMAVGLTGTPIENSLRELKSLFDIVLPSYMPSDAYFRHHFIHPIERDHDGEKKAILTRLIQPFILRRKKNEVLQELPEKSEENAYSELSEDQRILYRQVIERTKETLVPDLINAKSSIPYVHIFAVLSTLKQICNHPALFNKDIENYKKYSSGKWDLFVELLDEAFESSQKVVVFSQYLNMLDIIELYLKEKNCKYAQIRGSTVNRREELKEFQTNPDCKVFLASLQAAGLGVDLTSASIVIHFDRWWNAARENQATDRVHRLGQKRGVQVFKLITKNTLEEKIDQMIIKKGKLMEEIIASDDQNLLKNFTREELLEILTQIDEIKP